ncbi:MAG: prepilin-type N-terminal cleavage/methylation domain-containing protein [Planctomycetota bacterium]|jgi:prepilin-type N-terminal cleavage/methylation domain-containing protein
MKRLGFTLIEMVVTVAVLAVVIVAAGRIFQATGTVVGVGLATADILQEAAAVERQIRGDLAHLSREGFLAIRCVAVPNDVNGPAGLLDPALEPDAVIRADQLVFFTHGAHSIQTLRVGSGADRRAQGAATRAYYGPVFQVPAGPPIERAEAADDVVWAIDPEVLADEPLVPWSDGQRQMQRVRFQRNATDPPGDYVIDGDYGVVDATQPRAGRWLLARQAVVLADDGGSPAVFLFRLGRGGFRSTSSIGDDAIRNGRVDVAARGLGDIRADVVGGGGGGGGEAPVPWSTQRSAIADLLFYPRAERVAPGTHRVDQALTSQVLAGACSSFVIDWTWSDGVGDAVNDAGQRFRGLSVDGDGPQPWFGLDPAGPPGRGRGVRTLTQYVAGQEWDLRPQTFEPCHIEQLANTLATDAGRAIQRTGSIVYEAIFGYNQHLPLDRATGAPWAGGPDAGVAYTPWPSALRITMTLRDTAARTVTGREVQFVLHLD